MQLIGSDEDSHRAVNDELTYSLSFHGIHRPEMVSMVKLHLFKHKIIYSFIHT